MTTAPYVGALDQGTGGTRFAVFDTDGTAVSEAFTTHNTLTPGAGRIEYDPRNLWGCATDTIRRALVRAEIDPAQLRTLGVSSQRQTALLWAADTGRPVTNAISWQDRRTADRIAALDFDERRAIRHKTGLEPDPYFAAPAIQWLLDNGSDTAASGAERAPSDAQDSGGNADRETPLRRRAAQGDVLAGTVDSWLLYNLTGVHATDITNAAQTLLFDIHAREWDDDLLSIFDVPRPSLPTVYPSSDSEGFGETDPNGVLGAAVPVTGVMGDQQAALLGRVASDCDDAKVTYGTGNFFLQPTGREPVAVDGDLLTTIWFQRAGGEPRYGLEGPVFATGAVLEWLRTVGFLDRAGGLDELGETEPHGSVHVVPGFGGLGAPDWVPEAETAVVGVTRETDRGDVVRAAVRAIAFGTRAVVEAAEAATGVDHTRLLVDGGAVRHDEFAQWQANLLDRRLIRPGVSQTTALGAGLAAGLAVGVWNSLEDLDRCRPEGRTFSPTTESEVVTDAYQRWLTVVDAVAEIYR